MIESFLIKLAANLVTAAVVMIALAWMHHRANVLYEIQRKREFDHWLEQARCCKKVKS